MQSCISILYIDKKRGKPIWVSLSQMQDVFPVFHPFTRILHFVTVLQQFTEKNALYSLDRRFAARYSTGDMPVYFLKT